MANCNKLFMDFNKEITPTEDQMQKMKASREALETKISKAIQEKLDMVAAYYTQGSASKGMKILIIKADGTYDADRGVYLPKNPDVNAEAVQKYVYDAVNDHTNDGAEHRKKCIRVLYKSAYNIDFPVYYEVEGESFAYLAIKRDGWIKDDPAKMIEWFEQRKDKDGQLLRIVKYIKAWASERGYKMPSGIALTVWAARYFYGSKDRDDIALCQTLQALQTALCIIVTCPAPVEPYDDLVSKLDNDQKKRFQTTLKEFYEGTQKAIDSTNQLEASKLWQKFLGKRFPQGVDEDVDTKAKALMASAATVLQQTAKLDPGGRINETHGVQHQAHRNYGA